MKQKTYEFVSTQNFLWFEFESESVTKIVRKVVIFSPLPDNEDIYNIALVDVLVDGSFSDNVTTDNKDLVKVVATIKTADTKLDYSKSTSAVSIIRLPKFRSFSD